MRRALCLLSLACTFPAIGQAQRAGGGGAPMPGAHFAAAPAPMAAPRVAAHPVAAARPVLHTTRTSTRLSAAPKSTIHPVGWNHVSHGTNTPADPVFPNGNPIVNGYPVPGLGFDYTHYFAVHPNAGRCHRCQNFGFVLPFVDGGIYFPMPMYAEQPAEPQPAEEGAPQEQAAQGEEAPPPDTYSNPPPRPAPQVAPKQQAEYVFVRRDGTLIFAVGYSWINDRLQYVTSEGLRRTVSLDSIDLGATQQFNEQRGIPIQMPA